LRLVWRQQRDRIGDVAVISGQIDEVAPVAGIVFPLGQLGELDGAFTEFEGAAGVVIGAGHWLVFPKRQNWRFRIARPVSRPLARSDSGLG
jgi:hypothetical protein